MEGNLNFRTSAKINKSQPNIKKFAESRIYDMKRYIQEIETNTERYCNISFEIL